MRVQSAFSSIAKNDGQASFSIIGAGIVGNTLKVNEDITDPDDGTGALNYSWQTSADGNIWEKVGDSSTYKVTVADKGKSIKAVLSYTDGEGFEERVDTSSIFIKKRPLIRGTSLYTLITDNEIDSNNLQWYFAQFDAIAIGGGNLVTINDRPENEWIHKTFEIDSNPNRTEPSYYWTGLNDFDNEGDWKMDK